MRAVGIEPTLLSEPDFESGASTSSTTPARGKIAPDEAPREPLTVSGVREKPDLVQVPARSLS